MADRELFFPVENFLAGRELYFPVEKFLAGRELYFPVEKFLAGREDFFLQDNLIGECRGSWVNYRGSEITVTITTIATKIFPKKNHIFKRLKISG